MTPHPDHSSELRTRRVLLVDGPYDGQIVEPTERGSWLVAPFGFSADVNYEMVDDDHAEFRGFSQR